MINLQSLINSPALVRLAERLNLLIEEERHHRERFYDAITEQDKAEFINGEIVMHSPVRRSHSLAVRAISTLMSVHAGRRSIGEVHVEKLLISLTRNDYEPDIVFYTSDRTSEFTPDQMKHPAPDLIVEVLSPSTEENDRGIKMEDSAAHGVDEYWIVDPDARMIEQYLLDGDAYRLATKVGDGTITSRAIAGFRMNALAAFDEEAFRASLSTGA